MEYARVAAQLVTKVQECETMLAVVGEDNGRYWYAAWSSQRAAREVGRSYWLRDLEGRSRFRVGGIIAEFDSKGEVGEGFVDLLFVVVIGLVPAKCFCGRRWGREYGLNNLSSGRWQIV